MPIKSKPVNPQRAAEAAKGRLSSAGATYAERQAQLREQQRRWAAEEDEHDQEDEAEEDGEGPRRPQAVASATLARNGVAPVGSNSARGSDDEAAVLAEAQERTRRFLHAGNDIPCGQPGPPPDVERLVSYEAAKRRVAVRVHGSSPPSEEDERAAPQEDGRSSPTGQRASAVTVGDVLCGLGKVADPLSTASSVSSPPVPAQPKKETPPTINTSNAPAAHADPLRQDFERLMDMLGEDVRREQQVIVGTTDAGATPQTVKGRENGAATSANRMSSRQQATSVGYRPPPRTFAQLQTDALQALFEDWSGRRGDDAEGGGAPARAFVAAEHEAAAFALAAASAREDGSLIGDAPLSFEELAAAEAAMRNATKAKLVNFTSPRVRDGVAEIASEECVVLSARGIAAAAQGRLSRFLQAVSWTERLVRDAAFVSSVAAFLYEHHRTFLPHVGGGSASPETCAAAPLGHSLDDDGEGGMREHTHEEFAVYEQFGQRVSDVLLRVLADHVAGFDEEEFVEALFDSPEEAYAMIGTAGAGAVVPGPQNVLSYPAWRIILSMSSFESFFLWMMDYIHEEYQLAPDPVREEAVVAVAGARGLRALIKSTYHHPDGFAQGGGAAQETFEEVDASPLAPAVANDEVARGHSAGRGGQGSDASVPNRPNPQLSASPGQSPLGFSASLPAAPLRPTATRDVASSLPSRAGSFPRAGANGPPMAPVTVESQLSHLREAKRFYPTPPSLGLSEGSLRPRNSHVGAGALRGKRPSAAAARDLPPLSATPPPPEPLGAPTPSAQVALRPSSQPQSATQPAGAARGRSPSRTLSGTAPRGRSATRSTSSRGAAAGSAAGAAPRKSGSLKPKLKRAV